MWYGFLQMDLFLWYCAEKIAIFSASDLCCLYLVSDSGLSTLRAGINCHRNKKITIWCFCLCVCVWLTVLHRPIHLRLFCWICLSFVSFLFICGMCATQQRKSACVCSYIMVFYKILSFFMVVSLESTASCVTLAHIYILHLCSYIT